MTIPAFLSILYMNPNMDNITIYYLKEASGALKRCCMLNACRNFSNACFAEWKICGKIAAGRLFYAGYTGVISV